jgi:hypothetical protein
MTRTLNSRSFWTVACAWLLAASLSPAAIAQNSPSPPATAPAPAAQQPAPVFPSQPAPAGGGFLHQLGVWWNDGFGDFDSKMKAAKDKIGDINKKQDQSAKDAAAATQDVLKGAAEATKDAAVGLVKLPTARMFELHDLCRVAGNGAPDCQATATNACHGKGFNEGKPLGVSTAEVCPTAVLMSGRPPGPGDCRDETYLLGVYCQ